jgi:hypothetical protein
MAAAAFRKAIGLGDNTAGDIAKLGRPVDGVTEGTKDALQSSLNKAPAISDATDVATDVAGKPSSSWFSGLIQNNPKLAGAAAGATVVVTTTAPVIVDTGVKAGKAGKNADEVADGAADGAGKNADEVADGAADAVDGAAKAGKNADEVADGAVDAATKAGKDADEVASLVKKADEDAVLAIKEAGKQTPTQILTKKNFLTATGLALTITAATLATDSYFKLNNKKYNIISIDDKSSSSNILTQITIQAGDTFTTNDKVKLENTNCVPSIQGEFIIEKVISKDVLIIKTPYKVTTKGTNGTLTFLTTFESQFAKALKDTIKDATTAIGSTVGAGLTTGLKNTLDSFFISLGISPENLWLVYTIIFIIFGLYIAKNIGII